MTLIIMQDLILGQNLDIVDLGQLIQGEAVLTNLYDDRVTGLRDAACYGFTSNLISLKMDNLDTLSNYALTGTNIKQFNGKNIIYVGTGAFYGCTQLSKVTLGSKLLSIGTNAFSGCTVLSSIYINAISVPTLLYSQTFESWTKIYVPSNLYSQYISTINWSNISSQIISR